jgi:hypothetical protein
MSSIPTPQLPQYRITLFYGPEPVAEDPPRLMCVFNVKKRSWKGGVQIAVELDERQLAAIRQQLGFEEWLKRILEPVPEHDRDHYESRACDLLIQEICALKLSFALESDIRQENARLEADRFADALGSSVCRHARRIESHILTELDLSLS